MEPAGRLRIAIPADERPGCSHRLRIRGNRELIYQCPEPEVRAHRAANAIANFGFKRGTRIIELLVVLGFRSSLRACGKMIRTSESDH